MSDFELTNWLEDDSAEATAVSQEASQPVLSSHSVRILNFVEQVFWSTGLPPTPEAVASELSYTVATVQKAFKEETFREQLTCRGIDVTQLASVGAVIKESKALSAQQLVCANVMLNMHDKRSEREKLQKLNISSQQYHAWLRNPTFQAFMTKRAEALFSSSDFKAYKSLLRNVEGGDSKSIELFFRMRGIYNPSINVNINIEAVLLQVVEAVSKHVKDPLVLQAIAGELENLIEDAEVVA